MIQQGQVYSFIEGLLTYLTSATLKMALYTGDANMTLNTITAYTTANEVVGTGYVAGGEILTGVTVNQASNGTVYVNFNSPVWTSATFTCRGAMIYNSSDANKAIALIDFGSDKVCVAKDFTVTMPANTYTNALIRIESNG